jgi:peptidoglycan/xylan/chitin deacetylase (PgdA/CDA1 family)
MRLSAQRIILVFGAAIFVLGVFLLRNNKPRTTVSPSQTPIVAGNNRIVDAGFEENNSWGSYGRGYARDRAIHHSGDYAIRVSNQSLQNSAGAIQQIDLHQTDTKPVFVGAYLRGEHIALSPDTWVGASIYAEIILKDGSVVYWNSIRNSGTFDWRWVGFNTGSLPQVNQPIDHIRVIPAMVGATGTAWFDDVTVLEFEPQEAAITLMFDDGFESAYTIARPELDAHGFPGAAAVVNNWVGRYGYLTEAQVKKLERNGWEIVAHTLTHTPLSTLSHDEIIEELRESKRLFQEQGLTIYNHAFPFGDADAFVLATAAEMYRSARTYVAGNNAAGTFPYSVRIHGMTPTTTAKDVQGWLEEAKLHREWAVLVFHDITKKGRDSYDISPERFKESIAAVAKSGLPVITYNEGVNRFAMPESLMHRDE